MPADFDDAERWRILAEEAITSARGITEPDSRRLMLFIADAYMRLAERTQFGAGVLGRRPAWVDQSDGPADKKARTDIVAAYEQLVARIAIRNK